MKIPTATSNWAGNFPNTRADDFVIKKVCVFMNTLSGWSPVFEKCENAWTVQQQFIIQIWSKEKCATYCGECQWAIAGKTQTEKRENCGHTWNKPIKFT